MTWFEALSALIAVLALLVAGASWRRAGSANQLACDANNIGIKANTIAAQSGAAASQANRISEKAVTEARRSADAAEAAEARQLQSEARALEVHDVDWHHHWDHPGERFKTEALIGLTYSLQNIGTDSAHDVSVRFDVQGDSPTFNFGTVAPGPHIDVVPISDETSRDLLDGDAQSDANVSEYSLARAGYWLTTPTRVVVSWKTKLGTPKRKEFIERPFVELCDQCNQPMQQHHHHH